MTEPVRYFLDEHIDPAVAAGLRRTGIDVLTVNEAGRSGYADDEQLEFATRQGRVMVSHDSDYLALHSSGVGHAGIAWCPALKHPIGRLIAALEILHGVYTADDMLNHVEYL